MTEPDPDRLDELLTRSSLGTPGARAVQALADPERTKRILALIEAQRAEQEEE